MAFAKIIVILYPILITEERVLKENDRFSRVRLEVHNISRIIKWRIVRFIATATGSK